ncbi:MAG: thioredoxin-dependent thiol peroxidase [Blastocatellia bacterium]|nr:thioredoxin-dependent thiol peroxidase [Blastocatellia bacterium]
MPSVGEKAPALDLKDVEGRTVKLATFRGKRVVLYFYPRDLTPGCTKEACGFQSDLAEFERRNAAVLGVSTDDASSHKRFSEKYGLAFPLLSDEGHKTAETYGVWQEKNMYGRKIWGIKRTTFIIDERGRIARVFARVKPDTHSREVLDALDRLD